MQSVDDTAKWSCDYKTIAVPPGQSYLINNSVDPWGSRSTYIPHRAVAKEDRLALMQIIIVEYAGPAITLKLPDSPVLISDLE